MRTTKRQPKSLTVNQGIPEALPFALKKWLEDQTKEVSCSPGKHRIMGRVTLDLDLWYDKAKPFECHEPLPSKEILAVALEQLFSKKDLDSIIDKAYKMVQDGESPSYVNFVLDRYKDKQPTKERQGNGSVTGEVKIVSFKAKKERIANDKQ